MAEINEACGVFGAFSADKEFDAAAMTYYGLYALQHRGQESSGIAVCHKRKFFSHIDTGLVSEVFSGAELAEMPHANIAIGHVRYGTTGQNDRSNAQPVIVSHRHGQLAVAHNGNIVNADALREELELSGSIFYSTNDTEIIAHILTRGQLKTGNIKAAADEVIESIRGAYSLVIMTEDKLVALRDENGFRPLCYGITADGIYAVASETCALNAVGAKFIRDILPGEIVVFDKDGVKSYEDHCRKTPETLCILEFIYFARPDSVIEKSSVHNARLRAGEFLADEHPVDADVVIGIPDSGVDAAIGFSRRSGIPYDVGLIKNKYIGRTFILPDAKSRHDKVTIKLNPVNDVVRGKRVVLIDDSIVRGTTSANIVKRMREAGATEVHMRIAAPPFRNACYYGTDIDSSDTLIAHGHEIAEIAKMIGVDTLGFLSLENVVKIPENHAECGFCTACFSGDYPTEIPGHADKNRFEL